MKCPLCNSEMMLMPTLMPTLIGHNELHLCYEGHLSYVEMLIGVLRNSPWHFYNATIGKLIDGRNDNEYVKFFLMDKVAYSLEQFQRVIKLKAFL